MQVRSNDIKIFNQQVSSLLEGSNNIVKDYADFHSEDTNSLSFLEIQDMSRVSASKGYAIHPILAELMIFKPGFDVVAGLDGDAGSISISDLKEVQSNPEAIAEKLNNLFSEGIIYKGDEETGLAGNFVRSIDLSEMATYQLSDITALNIKGNQFLLAIEKDLDNVGEARSVLFIRSTDSKSFKVIDLEQFQIVNTGFGGIDLKETEDEYILTIVSNMFNSSNINIALDENNNRIINQYSFMINGKECVFTPPDARLIVRDVLLSEQESGLPIKLLVELRQKDYFPVQISSFYYLHKLYFPKDFFLGDTEKSSVRNVSYLMEAGRSSRRQADAMREIFGRRATLNLEGVCNVGDRVYMMNSDNDDGIPTYFYVEPNGMTTDKKDKVGSNLIDIQRVGDFGELSDRLGIDKIVTFGIREKDGCLYSLHGQAGNFKDFFIVKVKESDLRNENMQDVYSNMEIIPVNLDGYTNRNIRPFGLFFSGEEIGIGIKDGNRRSAVLFFNCKKI